MKPVPSRAPRAERCERLYLSGSGAGLEPPNNDSMLPRRLFRWPMDPHSSDSEPESDDEPPSAARLLSNLRRIDERAGRWPGRFTFAMCLQPNQLARSRQKAKSGAASYESGTPQGSRGYPGHIGIPLGLFTLPPGTQAHPSEEADQACSPLRSALRQPTASWHGACHFTVTARSNFLPIRRGRGTRRGCFTAHCAFFVQTIWRPPASPSLFLSFPHTRTFAFEVFRMCTSCLRAKPTALVLIDPPLISLPLRGPRILQPSELHQCVSISIHCIPPICASSEVRSFQPAS